MQCPRCQQNNASHAMFCLKCGAPVKPSARDDVLEASYPELQRSLSEALARERATAEILRVIGSSPTDAQPVFETIARSGVSVCAALGCVVFVVDGDILRVAATHGVRPERVERFRAEYPIPLTAEIDTAQTVRERSVFHLADIARNPNASASDIENARLAGYRTRLMVPMVRGDMALGLIAVTRETPTPFSDQQVELLKTFADQAVIAIENVRLFTELQEKNQALTEAHVQVTEALEQQTATGEILRVISGSPTNVQPVFDTILDSATRLCAAENGILFQYDDGAFHTVACLGLSPKAETAFRAQPARPGPHSGLGRMLAEQRPVQVADVTDDIAYRQGDPLRAITVTLLGARTAMWLPLLKSDAVVGALSIYRRDVRPFTAKQIDLVGTFADQAVIAIENVRLFTELQEKNRALTEAHAQVTASLEQQTATSEILRVISSSPTDAQPVFDAIAESAVRLLRGSLSSTVTLLRGEELDLTAFTSTNPSGDEAIRRPFPMALDHIPFVSRVVRNCTPYSISDVDTDPSVSSELRGMARERGWRSCLWVPMLRDGTVSGVISVTRRDTGPFADEETGLLRTFADQAVIAIENVRLFKELEARNRDLSEALEQQTATSEILRVISSSPTDVQPVFESIAASALRLCDAKLCTVFRFDGELIHLVALHAVSPEGAAAYRDAYPASPGRGGGTHRAILTRSIVHIPDIREDPEYELQALARANDFGCVLSVPMLRDGHPIGAITVGREAGRPFPNEQIALLKTFADQAVIAIENVRLFKELEARNRDLTATSQILQVISSSPTDVQPVFDTIVKSAVRLCDGLFSALHRFDGELLHLVAHHNYSADAVEAARRLYPARPSLGQGFGRAILERAVVHIPDAEVDPEYQAQALSRAIGFRSGLFVPMLREGEPIGAIMVARAEPGPFSDNEIELLKTFADQAVIAIENVRLFKELEARTGELTRSVEKLTALGEVSHALSSTLDVEAVLNTIVSRASQLAGGAGCSIYEYDEAAEQFELRATHYYDAEFVEALRAAPLRKGEGLMGRAAEMREPVQIPDIIQSGAYQSSVRDTLIRFGYRALLSVPLLREDQIIGSLSFNRKAPGEFPPEVVDVLKTFATQSALAIQNARLFREIADKSRQLEAASRHKSEFLANMSHELRTPLNAVIGFSEVLLQRMFGALNDKQDEYLKDIYASGQHLLSLINDILDLSKIEAGRMELAPAPFHLPTALENAVTLVRERAARHGIALHLDLDPRLGELVGDERKVKQVLLNLLSNAVKFTPEGGRISLKAGQRDGLVEIAVTDTGIGIAPEDQGAIFEEFRQVGSDETRKQEGTGLGLTLAKKFVELHGGRIWVESEVGRGSTFTFTLPVS